MSHARHPHMTVSLLLALRSSCMRAAPCFSSMTQLATTFTCDRWFTTGTCIFTNDLAMIRDGDPLPWGRDLATGRPDNGYTVGHPLLVAPVYILPSLVLARIGAQGTPDARFPLFLDQLIFSYASFLLGAVGMWLSFRFACVYFAERDCLFAPIAFWLCSPLIYCFAREPFPSHLASVFAFSLLLYIWTVPR
jgi:hypothetical protein